MNLTLCGSYKFELTNKQLDQILGDYIKSSEIEQLGKIMEKNTRYGSIILERKPRFAWKELRRDLGFVMENDIYVISDEYLNERVNCISDIDLLSPGGTFMQNNGIIFSIDTTRKYFKLYRERLVKYFKEGRFSNLDLNSIECESLEDHVNEVIVSFDTLDDDMSDLLGSESRDCVLSVKEHVNSLFNLIDTLDGILKYCNEKTDTDTPKQIKQKETETCTRILSESSDKIEGFLRSFASQLGKVTVIIEDFRAMFPSKRFTNLDSDEGGRVEGSTTRM